MVMGKELTLLTNWDGVREGKENEGKQREEREGEKEKEGKE